MSSIVLGTIGTAVGTAIGGPIGGTIGGMIGSAAGAYIDSQIIASMQPDQRIEGQRLDSTRVMSSTEGAVIPQVFGRMRLAGNVIWATDFREEAVTSSQGGGKGGGPKVNTTEYLYYASFAVALCEGEIGGIGRMWGDGEVMDLEGVTWRWYRGDEEQDPDPFIAAKMGAAATPAYRGVAYLVFEDLPLAKFGNRLPQITVEVLRPLADDDTAEGLTQAITVIPASGEFAYATEKVRRGSDGEGQSENANASASHADFIVAMDRLEAAAPNLESVSLVVAWFGDDLRAGECRIRPGVEVGAKETTRDWSVNGVERADAYVVSQDDQGRPVYGGTPADFAVVQAIKEIKARGWRVTFYPFILMDVPEGNSLANPYSDNAAEAGQPAFPWRGRITCSPAAGYAGTVDKTGDAGDQVDALFGTATPGASFDVDGEVVTWTGPAGEWSIRRMVLHYAHLCDAAGGVDAFLIGSEMRGLTQVRDTASHYPAVGQLQSLAGACRVILGAGTEISYAADWSEYFGHHPADGSGDVFFHLDPLWADEDVDFVAIDNYMPLSDWRDGFEHADAADFPAIYDRAYLQANVEGGEGFDWYYASAADRAAQVRTPITDAAEGKPWVFRYKDLRSWWSNTHYNRPGGTEAGGATAWTPESKPIRFTEFGCPAIDRGANQPNVFYDPKSSESFVPYFSRGWRDDAMQRAYLEATLLYWGASANNPSSSVYGGRMIDVDDCAVWTWDARPYPFFPALTDVWADGDNWRLGRWLTGRLGSVSLGALVRFLCLRGGMSEDRIDVSGLWGALEGFVITAIESPRASIEGLARHFGFDACESEGRIVFAMRGRAPSATLTLADLVGGEGEPIEMERAQETELPQALKWSLTRSDEEYDAAVVEARRITVQASRVAMETHPIATPPEEAERRVRRALQETWVGRESATFKLPPSRLALDPGDVLQLEHDGRTYDWRLGTLNDGEHRAATGIRHDRGVYDLPPGAERAVSLTRAVVFGAPQVLFLDIPQISEDVPAHQPAVGAYARPWPGDMAVYRSRSLDNFQLLTAFSQRARYGATATALAAGPTSRLDLANSVDVVMTNGTLTGVTDLALYDGSNAFAVETTPGEWEILQAGAVELVSTGRYRLSRLLRGQRGTEWAMAPSLAPGARVVVLDDALAPLPFTQSEIGIDWNLRVGPAKLPVADDAFLAREVTPRGRGLEPFAVVHVEQPWRRGRTPGDLTIRWTRRSRDLVADSWAVASVPLAEEAERYEVDIMDGASVLRTLSTTTTSVVYTSAHQISDFGAELAPGDTLKVRIAQMSALVGRGQARTVTLQF